MISVNEIKNAIRSTEITLKEKQSSDETVSQEREKLSHLEALLKAVEHGLVRK